MTNVPEIDNYCPGNGGMGRGGGVTCNNKGRGGGGDLGG